MLARDPTVADPPLFASSVLSAMPYMRQLESATAPEAASASAAEGGAGLRGQGPRRSAARLQAVVFAYENGIVVAGDPG
jgi:hypothetical protein